MKSLANSITLYWKISCDKYLGNLLSLSASCWTTSEDDASLSSLCLVTFFHENPLNSWIMSPMILIRLHIMIIRSPMISFRHLHYHWLFLFMWIYLLGCHTHWGLLKLIYRRTIINAWWYSWIFFGVLALGFMFNLLVCGVIWFDIVL